MFGEVTKMYELSKERFRELKHFCLQYYEYKDQIRKASNDLIANHDDPVSRSAVILRDNLYAVDLIERTAADTDKNYGYLILRSVTEDVSFRSLGLTIPKGYFDDLRSKFFYLLSERKGV